MLSNAAHIGGVIPLRPIRTRFDVRVPSLFFATNAMILAPAFSLLFAPFIKLTIGVSGETTTFFSPSLYLTERDLPSLASTSCTTVALVIVLFGRKSYWRKPSAVPRDDSGKMWIAIAFWLPSASGIPVTPM